MAKRYFIELTVNFAHGTAQQKQDILQAAAARMAKGLCSIAVLLADRTDPRVRMHVEDDRHGGGEVDLTQVATDGVCPCCGHAEPADGSD